MNGKLRKVTNMSQMYAFHQTARGHLHISRDIPCEDSSDSYSADNGQYHIAIVADGHGDEKCFRSSVGSKTAVEVAMANLKTFAQTVLASPETESRFYVDIFTNPRYRQMTIKGLTDTIIAEWHDRVIEDYETNPPTEEELSKAGQALPIENIPHVYGTTLMAALMLPKCLIAIHQGDGRCDMFFEDGTVSQPIPWDPRCIDTATTSMCDADVAASIRSCVLDLRIQKVVACYLGSDGVEDAYRDTYEGSGGSHGLMGGVHTFYKDLSNQLATRGAEDFEQYLCQMLPEFSTSGRFSRTGSGDDVSVAGIVNIEAIKGLTEQFKKDVQYYDLEEKLFWKQDELNGKTRKHDILRKRMENAYAEWERLQDEKAEIENKISATEQVRQELLVKLEDVKQEIEQFERDSNEVTSEINSADTTAKNENIAVKLLGVLAINAQQVFDQIAHGKNTLEAKYDKLLEEQADIEAKIKEQNDLLVETTAKVSDAEQAYIDAKQKFDEFDQRYQELEMQRKEIQHSVDQLCGLTDEGNHGL